MEFDVVALLRRIDIDDVQQIIDKCRDALRRSEESLRELGNEIIQGEGELSAKERVIQLCKYTMYYSKYQFYRKAVSVFTDMIVSTERPITSFQQMANMNDVVEASMALRELSISHADKDAKRKKYGKRKKSRHRGKKESDSDDFDFD